MYYCCKECQRSDWIKRHKVWCGKTRDELIPIMREKYREDLTEGEARAMLEDCMRVLFYRDCRALNRIQIAKVTKDDGVLISDPYEIETDWKSASFVEPKGQLDGDGGW